MQPGRSAHTTGVLPHEVTVADAQTTTTAPASGAATTSTSAISGAGLKKWRPMTRLGRDVASAISATDSARWCWWPGRPRVRDVVERSEDRPLEVEILDRRFDDEFSFVGDGVDGRDVAKPIESCTDPTGGCVVGEAELSRASSQPIADRSRPRPTAASSTS